MKKFSVKFKSIFLAVVSLLLITGFFYANIDSTNNLQADSTYVYSNSTSYLSNLDNENSSSYVPTSSLSSYYNLSDYYPLVCENQTDSDYCWIYSSMKSLESSFMIQTGEYYNFSEVGLAYLYYSKGGISDFNKDGNFYDFIEAYQSSGLILESDLSNSKFKDMDIRDVKGNIKNQYSYIKNYATTDLNSMITPYIFYPDQGGSGSVYYWNKSLSEKATIVKKFIKNYGGLFAGINGYKGEQGCFVNEQGEYSKGITWFYDNTTLHSNYEPLNAGHAICVIGWNDDVTLSRSDGTSCKGAFLAMNSWGLDSEKEYFYVPYDYVNFYKTFCGFICMQSADEEITTLNSNNSTFTDTILKGSNQLNNYFCYTDTIEVSYKLNLSSFSKLSVKVTGGGGDYSGLFRINFDTTNKNVTIKLYKTSEFYGGYYSVNFYNDDELYGKRSIFIYSGTEIGGLNLYYNLDDETNEDYLALNNAFLNKNNMETIYVSNTYDCYFISMNLASICDKATLASKWTGFEMTVSEISEVTANSIPESKLEGLFYENTNSGEQNTFVLQIGYSTKLSDLKDGMLIRFKFTIASVIYDNCERDFYINMFVSGNSGITTTNLNEITYFLNDGINNAQNITRYPENMTNSITLLTPERSGYNFIGWYTDEDLTKSINQISKALSGDIKLYARWEADGTDYFSLNLAITEITDYNNIAKNLEDNIIYGDSIKITLTFTENTNLSGLQYSLYYYFEWKNVELGGDDFVNVGNNAFSKTFGLNFPGLKSGQNDVSVKVRIVINGGIQQSKIASLSFSVDKKEVSFEFSKKEATYDGAVHEPEISPSGFYKEDTGILYKFTCTTNSKSAGNHTWLVSEITNTNYTYANFNEASCVMVIKPRTITISWDKNYSQTYDGFNHFPQFIITNLVSGDSLTFDFYDVENGEILTECKNAGHYKVNIYPDSISNSNYVVDEENFNLDNFEFDIRKSVISIKLNSVTERVQTASAKRKRPTYVVYGNYYSIADIDVKVLSEGYNSSKSGTFKITCRVDSNNYELESVTESTYTLTGYYYVYYKLSNGKTFIEKVEEDASPVGVTKDDFNAPKFSKISYSDNFIVTGDDIYVDVDLVDYTGLVYGGIFVCGFLVVAIIFFIKKRESKVR